MKLITDKQEATLAESNISEQSENLCYVMHAYLADNTYIQTSV